jgi:hypothetical protein
MVQGAKSGGGVSAPIAQKIMEESLAMEKGYDPGLEPMTPAIGSFAQIEMVDFKKSAVPTAIAGQMQDDQETADHTDAPIRDAEPRRAAGRPDIRAPADARGKVPPRAVRIAPRPVERRSLLQRFFGVRPAPRPPQRPGGR